MYVSEIALLTFEGIIYSFHISLLIVLISQRKNKFSGAFYTMLRVLFVSDILKFIASFELRVAQYGLWREYFENDKIISKFYIHSVTYLLYTQFIIHAFIPFNRFTLFWFPLQYNKIWSKQWYTVLILIVPAIILSPTLLEPCKFIYVSQDLVFPNYENPQIGNFSMAFTVAYSSILSIFGAICNFFAFIKYYSQKKNLTNKNRKNEISMLYISCITLFAHFVYCSIMVSRLIFIENLIITNIIDAIWLFLSDVIILSGSLPLIFLSKTARKAYANSYFNFLIKKHSIKISPIKPQTFTKVNT